MLDQWIAFYRETEQDEECLQTMKTALLAYFLEKGYYFDVASFLPAIFDDFTFDRILSCWAGKDLHVYEEPSVSLSEEQRASVSAAIESGLGIQSEASGTFLCALYRSLNRDETCEAIECDVSESMTDILRRHVTASDLFFDPFCGCGALLSGVYDALMNLYYKDFGAETIESIHRKIVGSQLYGCAETPLAALIAKITLALKYKICCMDAQIAVRGKTKKKGRKRDRFDWVLSDLYGTYNRLLLLNDEHVISRFFANAEKYSEESGRLLVSFDQNFNYDPSALSLREKILTDYTLRGIVEYTDPKRKSALPMIYFLSNGKTEEAPVAEVRKQFIAQKTDAFHHSIYGSDAVYVRQNDLHPWNYQFVDLRNHDPLFRIESRCTLRLKDILQFYQGIITGCDKAFVVEGDSLLYGACIDECGVPWIKGKDMTDAIYFYGQYLLYTNGIDDIKQYPATKRRLELYKKLLVNRRECVKGIRAWYELQWGREKEMFLREKLIFPSASDRSRFFCDRKGYFFSADICAALLHEELDQLIDLEQLALLLNSEIYDTYLKSKIKKLGENRYAYYPNDIKHIMIPPIDVIRSFKTEEDVNAYFGL